METSPRFYKVERDGPIIIWKFDNPPRNLATIDTMNGPSWWKNLIRTPNFA
jgi:hypothetical protein